MTDPTEFAPGFLVAAPSLTCPFFNHAVVLLIDHGAEGSFGIVVNKTAQVRFRDVLGDLRVPIDEPNPPDLPVHVGGPVSPDTGWLVFDAEEMEPPEGQALRIGSSLGLTSSLEVLERIARGKGPSRVIMSLGYSGWGPGQLESEMKEGSWIPTDLDASIVFEVPLEERWEQALKAAGIEPAWLMTRDHPEA